MINATPILDWLNLPADAETTVLWDCLHDAELQSISSNLIERTMQLTFDVWYIRKFHKLANKTRFVFGLKGVQSARIDRHCVWPGACTIPSGASREEESRIIAEYQSKWRNESDSWNTFEAGLVKGEIEVEISQATLARRNADETALNLLVHVNDSSFSEIFIRSEGVEVLRTDGALCSMEDFLSLGEAYWEAFAERKLPDDF